MPYKHQPVMQKEVIEHLKLKGGGVFVDATLGLGGHTLSWFQTCPDIKVIGIDQDQEALKTAKENLKQFGSNINFIYSNFSNLKEIIKEPINGILFDLGLSSYQIDAPERGFSFDKDGPLDMRMDPDGASRSVKELLRNLSHEELKNIIKTYGEERYAGRIARVILEGASNIDSTLKLREVIEKIVPGPQKIKSVARVFQAHRIATNKELEVLEKTLKNAIEL